ncbi:hypothetical protein BJ508DRAFT_365210 [Ascobolus immersus RN42]|uniref:Uncharacterized protein n=1 Tax=Ascobolus immersus RN42 TaxID=1160509 RepID=A0A3N4HQH4_ASCIM|nr:hypothetical protein BJ508DRAFT_365210 [Ascobolus immersus RN42]
MNPQPRRAGSTKPNPTNQPQKRKPTAATSNPHLSRKPEPAITTSSRVIFKTLEENLTALVQDPNSDVVPGQLDGAANWTVSGDRPLRPGQLNGGGSTPSSWPGTDVIYPDPPPTKLLLKGIETTKLYDLSCLVSQVSHGRVLLEARLSLLDQNSTHARLLMRDGCAYAQLLKVPLSVSSKIKPGNWYDIIGEAQGIGAGDCGVVTFLGMRKPKIDIRPPFPPKVEKADWMADKRFCIDCGGSRDDEVHKDLELYEDCSNPVDLRTLECLDCMEWGHLWSRCPYLVSPSGVRPRVRSPELTLVEWRRHCSFDMRLLGEHMQSGAPFGGMEQEIAAMETGMAPLILNCGTTNL